MFMDLEPLARMLAYLGVLLLMMAGAVFLLSQMDIPWDRIPGNIVIEREQFTCVFPLLLSLGLSLLLTLILNLIATFLR